MSTGMLLIIVIGSAALFLGLVGCFLMKSDEGRKRRDDLETRRILNQPWDARSSCGRDNR